MFLKKTYFGQWHDCCYSPPTVKARLSLRSPSKLVREKVVSSTTGDKAKAKAVAVNMVAKTVEPEMEDYGWLGFLEENACESRLLVGLSLEWFISTQLQIAVGARVVDHPWCFDHVWLKYVSTMQWIYDNVNHVYIYIYIHLFVQAPLDKAKAVHEVYSDCSNIAVPSYMTHRCQQFHSDDFPDEIASESRNESRRKLSKTPGRNLQSQMGVVVGNYTRHLFGSTVLSGYVPTMRLKKYTYFFEGLFGKVCLEVLRTINNGVKVKGSGFFKKNSWNRCPRDVSWTYHISFFRLPTVGHCYESYRRFPIARDLYLHFQWIFAHVSDGKKSPKSLTGIRVAGGLVAGVAKVRNDELRSLRYVWISRFWWKKNTRQHVSP